MHKVKLWNVDRETDKRLAGIEPSEAQASNFSRLSAANVKKLIFLYSSVFPVSPLFFFLFYQEDGFTVNEKKIHIANMCK